MSTHRSLAPTLAVLIVWASCASGDVATDAGAADAISPPDAVGADAPPMTRTLSLTTSDSILPTNSVSCNQTDEFNVQTHHDNRYFRVFDLPALGITSPFNITGVTIGIEVALGGTGVQPVFVRLHRANQPLGLSTLVQINAVSVDVLDQEQTFLNVPISGALPAGSVLAVELYTPAGQADANNFFIGSNNSGESAPGYLVAPACSINDLTTTATLGFPNMHMVMKVTGTYNP